MKLLTYEISDRSLALTAVNNVHGHWNCTLVLSREFPDKKSHLSVSRRQFLCESDGDDEALALALDYTISCIDTFFPEFVEDGEGR